jgi:DNA-directed RNA polymerase sigma subunit (sigma70/sigma32)
MYSLVPIGYPSLNDQSALLRNAIVLPLQWNPHTLDEIGRALGLTRERIRQLEKQSLSKLRHPSRAQQLLDYAS